VLYTFSMDNKRRFTVGSTSLRATCAASGLCSLQGKVCFNVQLCIEGLLISGCHSVAESDSASVLFLACVVRQIQHFLLGVMITA
jgi:hypothetical protein